MAQMLILLSIFCFFALSLVNADCSNMVIKENEGQTNSHEAGTSHFTIHSGCYVIFPNDKMNMKVLAKTAGKQFKGLLLKVKDGDGNTAGTWTSLSSSFTTAACDGNSAGVITHKDFSVAKDPDQHIFDWQVPGTCKPKEKYTIVATVAESEGSWEEIVVNLVCNPDYSDSVSMMNARPPTRAQYCALGNWAIIPPKLSESFETSLIGIGKWKPFYGNEEFRFRRNNGSTATEGTGPDAAHDGQYYMHYEATGTLTYDMAAMYSPYGLQGCFCFSFWCHMKTEGDSWFTLTATAGRTAMPVSIEQVTPDWRQVKLSFLSDRPTLLIFQVFRGNSEKADIGIDLLEAKPGICDGHTSANVIDLGIGP